MLLLIIFVRYFVTATGNYCSIFFTLGEGVELLVAALRPAEHISSASSLAPIALLHSSGYSAFALVFHSTNPGPGVWQIHCGGRLLFLSPGMM